MVRVCCGVPIVWLVVSNVRGGKEYEMRGFCAVVFGITLFAVVAVAVPQPVGLG